MANKKVSGLTEIFTISDNDIVEVSKYISPGVYESYFIAGSYLKTAIHQFKVSTLVFTGASSINYNPALNELVLCYGHTEKPTSGDTIEISKTLGSTIIQPETDADAGTINYIALGPSDARRLTITVSAASEVTIISIIL